MLDLGFVITKYTLSTGLHDSHLYCVKWKNAKEPKSSHLCLLYELIIYCQLLCPIHLVCFFVISGDKVTHLETRGH